MLCATYLSSRAVVLLDQSKHDPEEVGTHMADRFGLIWCEYGSLVQVVEGYLAQGEVSAKVFIILWCKATLPAALLCFFYAALKIPLSISIPITRLEVFLERIYYVDCLGIEAEVIEIEECLLLDGDTMNSNVLDDSSNHNIPEDVFSCSRRTSFVSYVTVDRMHSFLLVELLGELDHVDSGQRNNEAYPRHVFIRDFGRILEDFQIHLALCEIVAQVFICRPFLLRCLQLYFLVFHDKTVSFFVKAVLP